MAGFWLHEGDGAVDHLIAAEKPRFSNGARPGDWRSRGAADMRQTSSWPRRISVTIGESLRRACGAIAVATN
jgi:hypothetical protein